MEEQKEDIKDAKPKKKSLIRKLLKIVMYIILTIVGLNVLLYVLLSIPAVQQKAKDIAVGELKSILKTELSIDELRLSLFNKVSLKGVYLEDEAKDTLLYAQHLDASINIWKLFKSEVSVTGINLDNFIINVNQKDSISDFNFQFVIDAFVSNDTTTADTTKSALQIRINDVNIQRGRLNYDVLSAPETPGIFNASHISVHNFEANIDLNSIDSDKFDIELNSFAAKEKSGLIVNNLEGHFFSDKAQLWIEGLELELPNSHLITTKARYNLDSSEFEIDTQDTEISPEDVVAFLPNIKFLTNKLSLKTNIKGSLPFIDIENLLLTYGEDFELQANANMSDVMRYGNSDINLSIDKFKMSPEALTSFVRLGDSTFVAPDILRDMGDIRLKGELTGRLDNFNLNAEAWSKQGSIILAAKGATDTTFANFDANAKLETRNFGLGKLIAPGSGLGNISARTEIRAKQTGKQPLSAQLSGNVDLLQYKGYNMKNIPFKGFYNAQKMGGSVTADWRIGRVHLDAEMSQAKTPDIKVNLEVDSLQIDPFYKNEAWRNPVISLRLDGNMKGTDIDHLNIDAQLRDLDFRDSTFRFQPGLIALNAGKRDDGNEYISLTSSFLSASIEGEYKFSTIADEISNLMHEYMANVFQSQKRIRKEGNNFMFNISTNNTEELGRIFSLPFDIIEPSHIDGRINTIDSKIDIQGNLPFVRFGEMDIKNTKIDIANRDSMFNIDAGSKVMMGEGFYDASFKVNGANSSLHAFFDVKSNNTEVPIDGGLETLAQFNRDERNTLTSFFQIIPSNVKIANLDLHIMPAFVINKENSTKIEHFALSFNKKKYISIDGTVSGEKTDSLKISFDHAEVADVLKPFNINNIAACIHGDVLLTNILNQPELYTKEFEVADIVLFSDTLGTLSLESQYSEDIGGVRLDANLKKGNRQSAMIDGFIYPSKSTLDLSVMFNKMPLDWAQPFIADLLNKLSGSISSGLSIEGKMAAPSIEGWFKFNNAEVGINYTNVIYQVSDTIIEIHPQKIGFDGLVLKDRQGGSATVNATMTHHDFENMKYSLDMNMNNLMVLNTENRTDSLFYGRLFASGNVKINGSDDGINMNMNIRNDKNSIINILLPQTSEASDYKSIVYINVPEEKKNPDLGSVISSVKQEEESLPIKLNMNLNVNPNIALGVVINPATGDHMQAKGSGQIRFGYDMQTENMNAFGDYTLSEGNVKINLQRIKNLEFKIRQGSKLTFVGDPLKTQFNITAYRRVRADISTLDASFDESGGAAKVNVDCILGITGNMDKMTLTYDIDLPDAPDDIKRRVNSIIVTDDQKVKQFAYLVAFNSFYSSGGGGGNIGDGLWTSLASTTISGALNSVFGSILGDGWEIGTNIESNDGTFDNMDMSVNVSKKFLDDRLKVNTNLGYRTDQVDDKDSFIGDFEVEYMLSPIWTLKAYNHTNDRYYRQTPYTQGVGIMYTREARTLKRLFNFFSSGRRRRSGTRTQETPQNKEQSPPANTTEKQPVTTDKKE